MKSILITLALCVFFSCGTKKISGTGEGQTIKLKAMDAKAELGKVPANSEAISIESAKIKGNTLILDVSYMGGCTDHDFRLIGSQMISKSLPPIRSVKFVHNANGDECKATVKKTLNFDISELAYKQEKGSEIILKVEGVSESLKYTYE